MADFLGVQEVAAQPWFDTKECVAAYVTSGGWNAFWKKRQQGLPVEQHSKVTVQAAAIRHEDSPTPSSTPHLLETQIDMDNCDITGEKYCLRVFLTLVFHAHSYADIQELLSRSCERDELHVPFSAPTSALEEWADTVDGMTIPQDAPFELFIKVKRVQANGNTDSLEYKNEEKFRKAHRERAIGNEGVKQAAWQVADMHYKQSSETLESLFAPIDSQPRLKVRLFLFARVRHAHPVLFCRKHQMLCGWPFIPTWPWCISSKASTAMLWMPALGCWPWTQSTRKPFSGGPLLIS